MFDSDSYEQSVYISINIKNEYVLIEKFCNLTTSVYIYLHTYIVGRDSDIIMSGNPF